MSKKLCIHAHEEICLLQQGEQWELHLQAQESASANAQSHET